MGLSRPIPYFFESRKRDEIRPSRSDDDGAPPLPLAEEAGVGVLPQDALFERRIDFPHPPRFARRPPPQAGEVKGNR